MPQPKGDSANATRHSNGRQASARSELTRAAIYENAERLFAERGYAGTTPQDIADAVGMSRQTLYYYVNGKHEILATLVSEMTTNVVTDMQTLVADADNSADALRRLVEYLVKDRARNAERFRLLDRSESALPDDLAAAYLDGRRKALALLTSVIESGVVEGRFFSESPRISAFTILGMCNWVAWWFNEREAHHMNDVARQIARSAVATVLAPATNHDAEPLSDVNAVFDAINHQLAHLRALVTREQDTDNPNT